jgi:very-short-patch-repair endonuclease
MLSRAGNPGQLFSMEQGADRLAEVLRQQNGVIRRDQAIAAGVTETALAGRVRRGNWERVLPRVFVVGVDPLDPVVRVRSAWLWAGEDCVIGGEAAAWWLGIRTDPPMLVDIWVPPHRRMSHQPNVRVRRGTVDATEQIFRNRIVVTAPERTCLDLARAGREDRLEVALRKRRTTPAQLDQSVALGRGRRGQVRARRAADEVTDNPWSKPERLVQNLFRTAGITGWQANHPVLVRGGVRYPDFLFKDIKLILEIDGREHHGSREAFEADRRRQNQLVEAGWTILRFTATQVTDEPGEVTALVRRTIKRLRTID